MDGGSRRPSPVRTPKSRWRRPDARPSPRVGGTGPPQGRRSPCWAPAPVGRSRSWLCVCMAERLSYEAVEVGMTRAVRGGSRGDWASHGCRRPHRCSRMEPPLEWPPIVRSASPSPGSAGRGSWFTASTHTGRPPTAVAAASQRSAQRQLEIRTTPVGRQAGRRSHVSLASSVLIPGDGGGLWATHRRARSGFPGRCRPGRPSRARGRLRRATRRPPLGGGQGRRTS